MNPYINREINPEKDLFELKKIDMNVDRLIKVNFTYSISFPL